jgi:hypothetical protein
MIAPAAVLPAALPINPPTTAPEPAPTAAPVCDRVAHPENPTTIATITKAATVLFMTHLASIGLEIATTNHTACMKITVVRDASEAHMKRLWKVVWEPHSDGSNRMSAMVANPNVNV